MSVVEFCGEKCLKSLMSICMKLRCLLSVSICFLSGSLNAAEVDFVKEVAPILEFNCVSCHSGDEPDGDFILTSKEMAFDSGSGGAIDPGNPDDSMLYTMTIVERTDDELMPPLRSGGPLRKEETELLKKWIEEGANWPEDVELKAKAKKSTHVSPDDFELVKKIHAKIVAQA